MRYITKIEKYREPVPESMTVPCYVPVLTGEEWQHSTFLAMTLYTALKTCNNNMQMIQDCYGSVNRCSPDPK